MTEETRYQRSKRIEHEKARHERIVGILIRPIEEEWEEACERYEPECRKSDIPSPWTDWDPNPERREFYEGDMPTAEEAKALCAGCPLLDARLCGRYAEATGQDHGVWNGQRRYEGKWVKP